MELDQNNSPNNGAVFSISTKFLPLRLSANKEDSIDMLIKVKNISNDDQLVSVDIFVPKGELLGFDPTCIKKHHEKRVGNVKAGDSTEFNVTIWSNNQTKEGTYPIELMIYSHYLDYDKVLTSMRKMTSVRVV